MCDKTKIAIIGYSGHAFVVLDTAKEVGYDVSYYTEKSNRDQNPFLLEYLGDEGSVYFDWNLMTAFLLGIGDNQVRYKIGNLILIKNKSLPNVVHPRAVISKLFDMGVGNFIGANVCINAFAKVGNFCILNTGSIIEHECIIHDGAHVAPGTVLAGNVVVGEKSFIGANAVVKQGIIIGENVVIGAGSTVVCDVPDNEIWAGNPAKKLK